MVIGDSQLHSLYIYTRNGCNRTILPNRWPYHYAGSSYQFRRFKARLPVSTFRSFYLHSSGDCLTLLREIVADTSLV